MNRPNNFQKADGTAYRAPASRNGVLENKTILVVDDDKETREMLRSALEQTGANVIEAPSVAAAFETYRRCPPHAVISDIRLGKSDGYALIKAIRETDAEYRGFTPVIAISGFSSPDDEARAMDSAASMPLVRSRSTPLLLLLRLPAS